MSAFVIPSVFDYPKIIYDVIISYNYEYFYCHIFTRYFQKLLDRGAGKWYNGIHRRPLGQNGRKIKSSLEEKLL